LSLDVSCITSGFPLVLSCFSSGFRPTPTILRNALPDGRAAAPEKNLKDYKDHKDLKDWKDQGTM